MFMLIVKLGLLAGGYFLARGEWRKGNQKAALTYGGVAVLLALIL